MQIGTKVRTCYEYSERGTVVKRRRGEFEAPGYVMMQCDVASREYRTGRMIKARLPIHRDMLAVCND